MDAHRRAMGPKGLGASDAEIYNLYKRVCKTRVTRLTDEISNLTVLHASDDMSGCRMHSKNTRRQNARLHKEFLCSYAMSTYICF